MTLKNFLWSYVEDPGERTYFKRKKRKLVNKGKESIIYPAFFFFQMLS